MRNTASIYRFSATLFLAISIIPLNSFASTEDVHIKDMRFIPSSINISVGTEVDVHNDDQMEHEVISTDSAGIDLGVQEPAQVKKYVFAKPRTYAIGCAFHPDMKLTVTVK